MSIYKAVKTEDGTTKIFVQSIHKDRHIGDWTGKVFYPNERFREPRISIALMEFLIELSGGKVIR